MHFTKDQFSEKFNNGWKKLIWPIYIEIPYIEYIYIMG